MPVLLQVSEVRDALYQAAGGRGAAGSGQRSTSRLGRLFHEVFAALVRCDSRCSLHELLADHDSGDADWHVALVDQVYRRLVGPRMAQHQAALQDATEQVLSFWEAIGGLCRWLGELYWTATGDGARRRLEDPFQWSTLAEMITTEQPLCWELHEPDWSDSVRLVGVADAVFRIPRQDDWCVVELKLGRTFPEVDLGQACLYHHMLAALASGSDPEQQRSGEGTMAVVSFTPERKEQLFDASELAETRARLVRLMGSLAGVVTTEDDALGQDNGPVAASTLLSEAGAESKTRPLNQPTTEVAPVPSPAHQELGQLLVRTFQEYGAPIVLDGTPIVSPTFVRFPVRLQTGVKLTSVKNRAAEIQVRLKLDASPLISVSEGRVVVDVQRPDRQFIHFSQICDGLPDPDPLLGCSRVVLGVDLDGQLQYADFSEPEHAHLLVAGTTGSGKTEWLRTAVAGLVATNTPQTLRLLLIDPKRNAFHLLRDSAFLFQPVVYPDEQPAADVLAQLADEMDARYHQMDGADSLSEHVGRRRVPLPRIVCVCDEYADLIQRSRQERQAVETQIVRLGAKARAAGIHLILATQQPSREIIKGALDANIPARVGLKMQSAIESRMLLGESGAEHLLGNGDLLFKDIGELRRMQSVYVPPDERDRCFAGTSAPKRTG